MGTKNNVQRKVTFWLAGCCGWLLAAPAFASTSGGDLEFVTVIRKLQDNALIVLGIIAVLGLVAALVKWAASQSNMEVASFGKWIVVLALIGGGVGALLRNLGLQAAVL